MKTAAIISLSLIAGTNAFGVNPQPEVARRQAIQNIFGFAAATAIAPAANALDMDAFMNSELDKDQKNCNPKLDRKCAPQLTKDQALCQYGQSGNARGEACKRVKEAGGQLPSGKPQGKSLGGAYAM